MKRSASLLAPLVVLLSAASICAQDTTGGGSTADFKRPANPPVHRHGIDLALSARREEALPHLIWVTQNGNRDFVEYHLARSWVARLEKK